MRFNINHPDIEGASEADKVADFINYLKVCLVCAGFMVGAAIIIPGVTIIRIIFFQPTADEVRAHLDALVVEVKNERSNRNRLVKCPLTFTSVIGNNGVNDCALIEKK